MKRISMSAIAVLICLPIFAQVNLSGSYGYSFKPEGNIGNDKDATGPVGNLVLLKMESNKYRFWLDVTRGWPSYNTGETDGTIVIKNDTASFDNTHEGAEVDCILFFTIGKNSINIENTGTATDCGFGNAVTVNGVYAKLKNQPLLNNKWLKEQYAQSPTVVITSGKAEVYKDEKCLYPGGDSFNKGDSLLSIAEADKSIYTEFITPAGKFIYGWIKKSTVKIAEPE